MTQKFQFGDMVKSREYIALSNKSLFFFRYSDEESDLAECLEQDGTFHFLKVEDLELIPHPDTVRLDYIQNRLPEIRLVECNEAGAVAFCLTRKSGFVCTNTLSPSIRETIDNAMQQEQTP